MSTTKSRSSRIRFRDLPYDVYPHIFGNLPPLDIIKCRYVSRFFRLASKERSVWIKAFWNSEAPIPEIDLENTPTERLEKVVVTAARMNNVWADPGDYEPTFSYKYYITSAAYRTSICWFMDPLVVVISEAHVKFFLENQVDSEPVFVYDQVYRPRFGWDHPFTVGYLDVGTNIFYVVHLELEGANFYLKIVSIKYNIQTRQFLVQTKHRYYLCAKNMINENQYEQMTLDVQNGCVVVDMKLMAPPAPGEIVPLPRSHYEMIHIATGFRLKCPYDPNPKIFEKWRCYPHHILRLYTGLGVEYLSFFDNPMPSSTNVGVGSTAYLDGNTLRPTHEGEIEEMEFKDKFFPRSSSSYMLIKDRLGHLELSVFELDPLTRQIALSSRKGFTYESPSRIGWTRRHHYDYPHSTYSIHSNTYFGAITYSKKRRGRSDQIVALLYKIKGMHSAKPRLSLRQFRIPPFQDIGPRVLYVDIPHIDLFNGRMLIRRKEKGEGPDVEMEGTDGRMYAVETGGDHEFWKMEVEGNNDDDDGDEDEEDEDEEMESESDSEESDISSVVPEMFYYYLARF